MPEWPANMSFAEILPAHVSPSAGNYCFKYDDDEAIYVITTAKLSNHFQTPCLMGVYIQRKRPLYKLLKLFTNCLTELQAPYKQGNICLQCYSTCARHHKCTHFKLHFNSY